MSTLNHVFLFKHQKSAVVNATVVGAAESVLEKSSEWINHLLMKWLKQTQSCTAAAELQHQSLDLWD